MAFVGCLINCQSHRTQQKNLQLIEMRQFLNLLNDCIELPWICQFCQRRSYTKAKKRLLQFLQFSHVRTFVHPVKSRHLVFHTVTGHRFVCFQHKLFNQLHCTRLIYSSYSGHLLICIKLKDFFSKTKLHGSTLNPFAFKNLCQLVHFPDVRLQFRIANGRSSSFK